MRAKPNKLIQRSIFLAHLNKLLQEESDLNPVVNLYVKGKRIKGSSFSVKAERKGLIVEMVFNRFKSKYVTQFHYSLWPSNLYEQRIFLSGLLSYIFLDFDHDLIDTSRVALDKVFAKP